MNNNNRYPSSTTAVDAGLRAFMLRVYGYMSFGLATSGIVAFALLQFPNTLLTLATPPIGYIVMLLPLAFVLVMNFGINKLRSETAMLIFILLAATMGVSFAMAFLSYTATSVIRVFFITSAMFGTMTLYGYTTKTNLLAMGSYMTMALIGLIIASVVNIFLKSNGLELLISYAGVLIFTFFAAYDAQALKMMYDECDDSEIAMKKSVLGALMVYLTFVNLFFFLLRILGERR